MTRVLLLGCLLSALICVQCWKPPKEVSCCIDKRPLCTSTPRCKGPPCKLEKCPHHPNARCRHKPCSCDAQYYLVKKHFLKPLTREDCHRNHKRVMGEP